MEISKKAMDRRTERAEVVLKRDRREAPEPDVGPVVPVREQAQKVLTSQAFLRAMVTEMSIDDARDIMREIILQAKSGESKAWDFIGKYALGGGKLTLTNPSILARKR